MFHRVKNVHALPDMILQVEFLDGVAKLYDVKPLMDKWPVFKKLKYGGLFDAVRVEVGGYGVVWSKDIDLACNELWENGKYQQCMGQ
ncbi:MAG: DUF2442 domain-containing protein [Fibromonadaceae bacterium]|jgi:hypothetical protein|nr:DUF2442 domain-containing protein [Fibromonadaceae bacterium]